MNADLIAEFEAKRTAIAELCQRYGVASLDLFGSGTTDQWRPTDSDLDFEQTFALGLCCSATAVERPVTSERCSGSPFVRPMTIRQIRLDW